MSDSLYGPMVEWLRERFGVEFELWDTGGGCTALVGDFGGNIKVYITDAPNSPNGHECTITDQPTRDRLDGDVSLDDVEWPSTVGFAVGVYHDEGQTQIAYGEYPYADTAELPDLVDRQLAAATRDRCGMCGTALDYSGEVYKLDIQVWLRNRADGEKKTLCPTCGEKLQAFLKGEQ
jgi:hypothetical protein